MEQDKLFERIKKGKFIKLKLPGNKQKSSDIGRSKITEGTFSLTRMSTFSEIRNLFIDNYSNNIETIHDLSLVCKLQFVKIQYLSTNTK